MWTLRKGEHAATIDLRVVPGVAAEIVLRVDGELRRPRLYRAHEQAELSGAIYSEGERAGWCRPVSPKILNHKDENRADR